MKKQKIANKKKELKNKEKTKTVKKGKMAEKNGRAQTYLENKTERGIKRKIK